MPSAPRGQSVLLTKLRGDLKREVAHGEPPSRLAYQGTAWTLVSDLVLDRVSVLIDGDQAASCPPRRHLVLRQNSLDCVERPVVGRDEDSIGTSTGRHCACRVVREEDSGFAENRVVHQRRGPVSRTGGIVEVGLLDELAGEPIWLLCEASGCSLVSGPLNGRARSGQPQGSPVALESDWVGGFSRYSIRPSRKAFATAPARSETSSFL